MLGKIKSILQRSGGATLDQLVFELGESRSSIAAALAILVERRRVSRVINVESGATCGSACTSCPLTDACSLHDEEQPGVEMFVWKEREREVVG